MHSLLPSFCTPAFCSTTEVPCTYFLKKGSPSSRLAVVHPLNMAEICLLSWYAYTFSITVLFSMNAYTRSSLYIYSPTRIPRVAFHTIATSQQYVYSISYSHVFAYSKYIYSVMRMYTCTKLSSRQMNRSELFLNSFSFFTFRKSSSHFGTLP